MPGRRIAQVIAHDKPLAWNETLYQTLDLLFEGRFSHEEVAKKIGIARDTLQRWMRHPDFKKALADKRADLEASLLDHGVAYVSKESRIIALAQMAEQARKEFEERPLLQEKRQIGRDEDGQPLYQINESFNRDAHEAFRQAVADIAKELGHRQVKVDHSGAIDISERVVFVLPERQEADVIDAPTILALPERSDENTEA